MIPEAITVIKNIAIIILPLFLLYTQL